MQIEGLKTGEEQREAGREEKEGADEGSKQEGALKTDEKEEQADSGQKGEEGREEEERKGVERNEEKEGAAEGSSCAESERRLTRAQLAQIQRGTMT